MEEDFTLISDTFNSITDGFINSLEGISEFLDDYKNDLNFKFRRKFRTRKGIKYSRYYTVYYPLKDMMFSSLSISLPLINSIFNSGDKNEKNF